MVKEGDPVKDCGQPCNTCRWDRWKAGANTIDGPPPHGYGVEGLKR
jgi:hypothetical protein